ncbi:vomeronasal type-1 receptor 4-like [Acomys russatus]|uniref:vomeronasal type-1 receptor 4-like n=1 Tax=Acomys russatus TaxID=60746 RepID=UPI0021E1E95F|nr:vomeronasal type-1 receptor 4-like [Acomys russatus]
MLSQNKTLPTTEEVALQILLLFQIGVGTVANMLLFGHNFSQILTKSQMRPIQLLLINLAVSNSFHLLLYVDPKHFPVFVTRKLPTDLTCKLGYFFHLIARSTNMCSTCSLSTYQFFTLVTSNWGSSMLRRKTTKFLSSSCYSCWLFSVLYNVYIPMKITGPQNTHHIDNDPKRKWVCFISGFNVAMGVLRFAHDAMFISIMIWTSVSMVTLLNRHHQRLQHIHTTNQDHRGYAETRATHTILMLVVTFVSFYLLDCICNSFHISYVDSRFWLRHIIKVLASSFPTISPLLLICRDPKDPCSVLFIVGLPSKDSPMGSIEVRKRLFILFIIENQD